MLSVGDACRADSVIEAFADVPNQRRKQQALVGVLLP